MKDLRLNTTDYDLAFDGEDFAAVEGRPAIAQELHIILRTYRGEWRLDEREGIDFFGRITGKNTSQVIRDAEIKRAISRAESIGDIVDYDVTLDATSRELDVDFSVRTLFDGDDDALGFKVDPLALPIVSKIADGVYKDGVKIADGPILAFYHGGAF